MPFHGEGLLKQIRVLSPMIVVQISSGMQMWEEHTHEQSSDFLAQYLRKEAPELSLGHLPRSHFHQTMP